MAIEGTALIGIDWGTSNNRAYRIDDRGRVLESRNGELGLSAIKGRSLDAALQIFFADWRQVEGRGIPVLMSGMIGSRNGWAEADYCQCPFGVEDLSRTIVPVMARPG